MFEISLDQIRQARERIKDKVNRTPCIYSLPLSRMTGKEVFLKLENLQVTQAFKARGNANKIALLSKEQKERGVIFSSTFSNYTTEMFEDKTHEVFKTDDDRNEHIERLRHDKFFNDYKKYNIIRTEIYKL